MAIFNEILSGRYNRALQKIFAVKGHPPVRQLSGELTPIHPMYSGVENRWIESWNLFASAAPVNAVAGQNDAVMLRNPAGSNVIGILERVSISMTIADGGFLISQDTGVAALSGGAVGIRCLDNRAVAGKPTTLGSTLQVSIQNTFVSTGGFIARPMIQANVDYPFLITNPWQEIPIAPGDAIEFVSTAINVVMFISLRWRERLLEESERI